MISVEEAKQVVLGSCGPLSAGVVGAVNTVGSVLAEDVVSKIDMPPFDQSAMDGYAIKGLASEVYKQVGEIKAGDGNDPSMNDGECVRIFTGAPVPTDADAVVMQEKTEADGVAIRLTEPPVDRSNIRPQGEQISAGDVGLRKGEVVSPAGVGFITTMGHDKVKVYPRPTVAIVATGSELQEPGSGLSRGQIYESNSYTLQAALLQQGISTNKVQVVDEFDRTKAVLKEQLETNDVLIISGGISVGDYDHVGQALLELGVEQEFHKVAQKPGKPIFYGTHKGGHVFALPGNPAAALTCYYEYVYPAIRKLMGFREPELRKAMAVMVNNCSTKGPRACFLKGKIEEGMVTALDAQSSAMLSSFARANCLIYVPVDVQEVQIGDQVEVHLLPE